MRFYVWVKIEYFYLFVSQLFDIAIFLHIKPVFKWWRIYLGGPTDLYTRCSLCPHRELFVLRRSYKHDGQGLPGGHEVILDLCVVGSYT